MEENNEREVLVSLFELLEAFYYANSSGYFNSEEERFNTYLEYKWKPIFICGGKKDFVAVRPDYFIQSFHDVDNKKVYLTNSEYKIKFLKDDMVLFEGSNSLEQSLFDFANTKDLMLANNTYVCLANCPEFIKPVIRNMKSGELNFEFNAPESKEELKERKGLFRRRKRK